MDEFNDQDQQQQPGGGYLSRTELRPGFPTTSGQLAGGHAGAAHALSGQQAPAPSPVLPWSQADTVSLARQQQALQQIETDLARGAITGGVAQQAQAQILPRYQGLLQKQQQHQARQTQQAVQAAMQQAALQEGILGVHKQARASKFGQEIATLVDPITGRHAYFTQDEKGNWDEVQFDHSHTESDHVIQPQTGQDVRSLKASRVESLGGRGGYSGRDSQTRPLPEGVTTEGDYAHANRVPELPEHVPTLEQLQEQESNRDLEPRYLSRTGAPPPLPSAEGLSREQDERRGQRGLPAGVLEAAPTAGKTVEQLHQEAVESGQAIPLAALGQAKRQEAGVNPDTFEQTIQSGPYTEKYRGGQLVESNRPKPEQARPGQISEQQLRGIWQMVQKTMPPLHPDAGPHERLAHQQAQQNMVHSILGRMQMHDQHQLDQEARTAEARRVEQARAAEWDRQQAAKNAQKTEMGPAALSPREHSDLLKGYIQTARKQRDKWQADEDRRVKEQEAANARARKDNPGAQLQTVAHRTMPEWMRSEQGVHDKALADYERHVGTLEEKRTGKKPEPQPGPTPAPGGPGGQQQPFDPNQLAGPPKPVEVPPHIQKQQQAAQAALDQFASGGNPPPPRPVSKEEWAKPSEIGADRVGELHGILEKAWQGVPLIERVQEDSTQSMTPALHGLLRIVARAKQEGRGLTWAERGQYEHWLKNLQHHMKKTGRNADRLKLVE